MKEFQLYLASILILLVLVFFFLPEESPKKITPPTFNNLSDFSDYARQVGAKDAYSALKIRFPNNEAAAHDFAHITGLVAYEKQGLKSLSICDTAYNYGCYHGAIEGALADLGTDAISQIEQKCVALGNIHSPSCLHGIGHGVLSKSDYQLETALADCDILMQTSQIYCWDGVFMERISSTLRGPLASSLLNQSTLYEPCNSLDTRYKETCWRNQVSAWFAYFQDSKKVLNSCQSIEKTFQKTCFESTGFTNVMIAAENKDKLVDLCSLNGETIDDCLIGEMKELLFEGKSPQTALSMCHKVSQVNSQKCQEEYGLHFNQFKIRFGR